MISLALRNLFSRPVRTLLALCGLSVAIGGMVGLLSIAEGIDAVVQGTFGSIPGVVVMQRGAPIPLFSRLPASWAEEARQLPGVHAVHPEVWTRAHLVDDKPTVSPPRMVFGVDIPITQAMIFNIYRDRIVAGRPLEAGDTGKQRCLVSTAIAREYKVDVGGVLDVDGTRLTVVGLYDTRSILLDVAIVTDAAEVRRMARMDADTICSFYVEPVAGGNQREIVGHLSKMLAGRRTESSLGNDLMSAVINGKNPLETGLQWIVGQFTPDRPDNAAEIKTATSANSPTSNDAAPSGASAAIRNSAPVAAELTGGSGSKPGPTRLPVEIRGGNDWADEFARYTGDLDLFLWIMTIIGISIATLGIINTMLMSVFERTIEFGILRANGWTAADVVRLIAIESGLLGLAGGVLGDLGGWLSTFVVNSIFPDRIHLQAGPMLLGFAFAFSTVLGLIGGLYPAIWAARKLPMEAIRRG